MTSISHQSDRGSGTTPASCFRTTTETSSGTYSPESSLVRSHKLVWLKLWENSQSPFSSILDLKYYSQHSRGNRKIRSPPYYQLIKHPTTKESNRPSWAGKHHSDSMGPAVDSNLASLGNVFERGDPERWWEIPSCPKYSFSCILCLDSPCCGSAERRLTFLRN